MRAPFDRLIDLFYGPTTLTPGAAFALAVPARVVPDEVFRDTEEPLRSSLAYFTADEVEPIGPLIQGGTAQVYSFDFGKSNTVALVSGQEATHYVQRVELRTWLVGSDYFRAYIAPVPAPAPDPWPATYHEVYRYLIGLSPTLTPLPRIGPTTWLQGDATLEAQITTPDPVTGNSLWRFTKGTAVYEATYNGQGLRAFPRVSSPGPSAMISHPI